VENRRLLRTVMRQAGFHPIAIEWWHFNAFEKDSVRARYAIVE
jgi:D-alanyl-D-alanine dipeptidase